MATHPAGAPAPEAPTGAQAPEPPAEDKPKVEAPSEGRVVFDPSYAGTLNSTQHIVTKTQLVEAGVPADKVFKDPKQTEVAFTIENSYSVPEDVFYPEAVKRLVQEPDISVQ